MDSWEKNIPENRDVEKSTEQDVVDNTNRVLKENLSLTQQKIIKELAVAKDAEERVKLFAKRTDKYGIDFIAWLVPILWDFTPAIVSTCYLLAEWIQIWLSRKDCLKILWYQTADFFVWSFPLIWDIADIFFKGNKYSSKIFSKHLKKLEAYAKEQWISQDEISRIVKSGDKFKNRMDKYNKK